MYRDGYVGMVQCYVITATLYVYFVDQCHPYIFLISTKLFLYLFVSFFFIANHTIYSNAKAYSY